MILDTARTRRYLKEFDFESLFIEELGWDHYTTSLDVEVDEQRFTLQAVAEKRGVVAFTCAVGTIPPYAMRRKIDGQVARSFREHFIIYVDGERTEQIWQWVRREIGRPLASREHHYTIQQPGDSLIQKLQTIAFSFEEEETLILVDVTGRVRAAFNVEHATRRFYDRFKSERDAFQKFLEGIPDEELERWYVSVMLNRLMFIYFIQKKGFLDGDPDYLRHKLAQSQETGFLGKNPVSPDRFYRDFLCPLFFEGFARTPEERSPQVRALLGDIPFLNGGIFQRHEVEQLHGQTIQIPDAAFERLFEFFDDYQWHLDDRPLRADNEINPDVLGYIFEKYVNQKQMGAYYTREDITGYISKNTVIPFLFDQAREKCRVAFEGEPSVWSLLAADPDRYIYEAVRKGTELVLPPEIAAGIDDVSQRGAWNTPTPQEYGLPTEIWRETVARRQRYEEIRNQVFSKNLVSINDLITYNLDIQQFAQDVIENCEGPELLRAFWRAINQVTVLDPTCGSGAFLFAALNILEPLYEACLHRMEAFVAELTHGDHHPHKYKDFREVLDQMERHPNRSYFVLKSIVVNNLYGVDIMAEAVEIAKLRLFLKLAAQVERAEDIEPLPDIDFNIRAGNTLVGFTTVAEVERAMKIAQSGQRKLMFGEDVATLQRIEEKAQDVDRLFGKFQAMQTAHDMREYAQDFMETKEELRKRLQALEDELNRYLAQEYGVDVTKPAAYQRWLASHQPFHWFTEFYGILKQGGFDVIIGNPPYVEYSKVKGDYTVRGYATESCGNLYAFVVERNEVLLSRHGYTGMIVPHSAFCTDRMAPVMKLLSENGCFWLSTYGIRPAKLFVGVEQRLGIYFRRPFAQYSKFCTRYNRWNEEARAYLFSQLQYLQTNEMVFRNSLPKVGVSIDQSIWEKIQKYKPLSANLTGRSPLFFHNSPRYWIRAMTFVPYFWNERGGEQTSSHVKFLNLVTKTDASVATAALNSSLFYWWFIALSNCRDLVMREIESFPLGLERMSERTKDRLEELVAELMKDYKEHAVRKETEYQATGQVVYDEFYPKHSKPIIDEIDRVLAQHYSFTDEELDFIINYDIKYRMGDQLLKEGEEE
jgi:cell fate (sporulation/competence/biofilm development) regulator YlbF (YheA/YmcA/DUF963 family)